MKNIIILELILLINNNSSKMIIDDICQKDYLLNKDNFLEYFDLIYSNNVFELVSNPFIAAKY